MAENILVSGIEFKNFEHDNYRFVIEPKTGHVTYAHESPPILDFSITSCKQNV